MEEFVAWVHVSPRLTTQSIPKVLGLNSHHTALFVHEVRAVQGNSY